MELSENLFLSLSLTCARTHFPLQLILQSISGILLLLRAVSLNGKLTTVFYLYLLIIKKHRCIFNIKKSAVLSIEIC